MSIEHYRVGLADHKHIPVLADIERAAAALFPDDILPPECRASTLAVEHLEAAFTERRLWTAATQSGFPVGFAIAVRDSDSAFLQEVDVHPVHQHRGLGRSLIRHVVRWARGQGLACVTLTTFESVPWNAPFYSRLGFRKLAEFELDQELAYRLQAERSYGLQQRIAMKLMLTPD